MNILEAKNRLSQLIKSALAGHEVVIANRGTPVARIVPVNPAVTADQEKGSAHAILAWRKSLRLPPHARRSPEEIDAGIKAERTSWD